jgi:pimeloyl-ACP methyl ester carboxylesterase
MEKFITAAGTALRISDTESRTPAEDTRPVIVLLHGYLESIEVWEDFTKLLKPHLRVIAIDLPGHGISETRGEVHTMEFLADTVHAVLEELGVEKCFVCGHSMGGYAALELLRKYPETLGGIVLFHSVAMADSDEKRENRHREIAVVEAGKKDLLATTVAKSFAPDNRKRFAARIEELADQVYLTEEAGVLALLRGMEQRRDNNDTLSQSTVPQLFIYGLHDEYIPVPLAEEMVRLHPRAGILWLEKSGHIGFVEEPKKSAEAIIDFTLKYGK